MIPMPMTPYDGFNILPVNTICFQLFPTALLHSNIPISVLDSVDDLRREVLVIFSNAEVKEELSSWRVLDEERVCWTRDGGEAFDFGSDEGHERDSADMTCRVDYADAHCF